eukprot:6185400-Pleurochrysis_carterae.AAC.5
MLPQAPRPCAQSHSRLARRRRGARGDELTLTCVEPPVLCERLLDPVAPREVHDAHVVRAQQRAQLLDRRRVGEHAREPRLEPKRASDAPVARAQARVDRYALTKDGETLKPSLPRRPFAPVAPVRRPQMPKPP